MPLVHSVTAMEGEEMSDELRILIIKEGDMLVGQCLEHDICAQASSLGELQRRMDVLFDAEARLGRNTTGQDFGHIGPAPQEFHDMWESAMVFEGVDSGRKMAMMAA